MNFFMWRKIKKQWNTCGIYEACANKWKGKHVKLLRSRIEAGTDLKSWRALTPNFMHSSEKPDLNNFSGNFLTFINVFFTFICS